MDNSQWVYIDEQGKEVGSANNNTISSHSPYAVTKSDKGDLLDKINPTLIVEIIRNKLMGKDYINGAWKPVKALQEKAISEVGAWDISNLMLSVSSQNVSLSRLKDSEIKHRTMGILRALHAKIQSQWESYGIDSTDKIYFIHEIVMSNTLITLKQSENAGIRALLQGTTTESRIVNTNENLQKRGWFGLRGR